MPLDMEPSSIDWDVLDAFLAAYPGATNPSKKVITEFLRRDTDAILARLDKGIPELKKRMDDLLERLLLGRLSTPAA